MALRSRKKDLLALPEAYGVFHGRISPPIPPSRIFCGPFRTLAFGTDAGFYRLVPKIVVKGNSPGEVAHLLRTAGPLHIPVTFRTAGTSLSGQAVTDSVLVVLAGGWRNCVLHDNGEKISLGPGIIGTHANARLAPYRRKIGPDPASIHHCMIGGVAANNASGICGGVADDRIYFFPELNDSAHAALRDGLPTGCRSGDSNSRTCEIGLSLQSGLPYQSIAYRVDRCAARKT
jgi:D-lactate dehydrogenase